MKKFLLMALSCLLIFNVLIIQELKERAETPVIQTVTVTDIQVVKSKEKWAYPLTEEEQELIFQIVAGEARGEDDICCVLVAESIRDRAITRDQSINRVCTAPNQYCPPYTGAVDDKTKEKINRAIEVVFKDGFRYYDGDIIHFHDTSVDPGWPNKVIARVDNMVFYD